MNLNQQNLLKRISLIGIFVLALASVFSFNQSSDASINIKQQETHYADISDDIHPSESFLADKCGSGEKSTSSSTEKKGEKKSEKSSKKECEKKCEKNKKCEKTCKSECKKTCCSSSK